MRRYLLILLFILIRGAEAQEAIQSIPYSGLILGLSQSPNGNYLLVYSGDAPHDCNDCHWKLALIETVSGVEIANFEDSYYSQYIFKADGSAFALVSPRGNFAKHIEIHSSYDGSLIREFDLPEIEISREALEFNNWSSPVQFSPDFRRLIHFRFTHGLVYEASIWNTETIETLYSLSCEQQFVRSKISNLLSPDGTKFIFGCNDAVNQDANGGESAQYAVIDVETGTRLFRMPNLSPITIFTWDNSSQYFATNNNDTVSIFEGEEQVTIPQFASRPVLYEYGFNQAASHFVFIDLRSVFVLDVETNSLNRFDANDIAWQQGSRIITMQHTANRDLLFQYIELDSGEVISEGLVQDFDRESPFRLDWKGDNHIVNFCDFDAGGELILRSWDAESNSFFDVSTGVSGRPSEYNCLLYFSSDGHYFAFRNCQSERETIVVDNLNHEIVYRTGYNVPPNINCLGVLVTWQNQSHRLILDNTETNQLEFYDFP